MAHGGQQWQTVPLRDDLFLPDSCPLIEAHLQFALELALELELCDLALAPSGRILRGMLRACEGGPLVFGDDLVAINELNIVPEVFLEVRTCDSALTS